MSNACSQTALIASLFLLQFSPVGISQETVAQSTAIRILKTKCEACHGASQIAGLDLRQRASLLKGGSRGPAIVPGNAGESLLYRAAAREGDLKMPPGGAPPLPPDELETLKKW